MGDGGPPDVVFSFAFETWADAYRRDMSWSADRMLERLLDDPEVGRVLVADPLRSRLTAWRHAARNAAAPFPDNGRASLVRPLRWRRRDAGGRRTAAASYRRLDSWLQRRARHAGLERPRLVTCHPVHAAVADRSAWADVVYYGWDDWAAHVPFAAQHETFRWAYAQLAARDVAVCAVTPAIVERIGAGRSTVVPNGMSAADYDRLPAVPEWFAGLPRPIALYAGTLEGRVDAGAVAAAARDLPHWSFVLVGTMVESAPFDGLADLANVTVRERHERPEVLAMMAAADVGMIPHRRTPMTEAMSPLKLYEYLGAGAPVVATDLPPMRGISDRVVLVDEGQPLAPALVAAADHTRLGGPALAAWRRQHDWDARYGVWRAAALGLA